ncbi:MAG: chemotaxis protein CheW [Candidatus Poribacteria bacterium]
MDEEKEIILKERAKALAQERKMQKAEAYIEVIEFLIAHEKYAIESEYICEAYPLKEITPLPCTPTFVLGLINVRGEVLSVIDIKRFFELPETELTDHSRVIIVQSDEMQLGILADSILGVRSIPLDEIQPSLPTLTGIGAEYLKGMTSEQLVVIDVVKILTDKNIVVHEEFEI